MNLSNGQKWFLVIMFGIAMAFFIIMISWQMKPIGSFSDPAQDLADRYHHCVQQAAGFLSGDNQAVALHTCKEIYQVTQQY